MSPADGVGSGVGVAKPPDALGGGLGVASGVVLSSAEALGVGSPVSTGVGDGELDPWATGKRPSPQTR